MRMVNLITLILAIVLAVSYLSIAFYPSAQDFMRANPFWNGLRDFSQRQGAELIPGLKGLRPRPGGTVLIAIPYLPYQDEEVRIVERFVREGGTLLVMDDYGYGNQLLHGLGLAMEFSGKPLLDPYLNYRNPWLPLVVEFSPWLAEAGIRTLILNHATALSLSAPYEVLATSSDMAFLDQNGNSLWDAAERKGPFAVAARAPWGRGAVVAVADPSILINSMVGRGDNGPFLRELFSGAGEDPQTIIDTSHLTKAPLDRSKDSWAMARERLAAPWAQVLLVGTLLTLMLRPLWQREENVEPK